MISPHIRWKHSKERFITYFKKQEKIVSGEWIVAIEYINEKFKFIKGDVIDGGILFHGSGYLCLAWETLGRTIRKFHTEISVIINIKLNRAIFFPKKGQVEMVELDSERQ
uniref:fatty acid synthase-like n=1 Tax=Vespula vulgaris TaxID=7454 RepID=UPI00223AF97B|nr:fatty acid synthase-like [Vespula vulgaris]